MNNPPPPISASDPSKAVRSRIVEALDLDLIGPHSGHRLEAEQLPGWVRPSNWYLSGFLVPSGAPPEQRADPEAEDEMVDVPESAGLAEESMEELRAAKKSFFPSSIGLSFLAAADTDSLSVTLDWGEYRRNDLERDDADPLPVWERTPRQQQILNVPLHPDGQPRPLDVPDAPGLQLLAVTRTVEPARGSTALPAGTRSVSLFLVNNRTPVTKDEGEPDEAFIFQPVIEVGSEAPFVPRPDPRGMHAEEWDDRVADLHYADAPEFATGHGVSAEWTISDGSCRLVRTRWLPRGSVEKTTTVSVPGVELNMQRLGELGDANAVRGALTPLVETYRGWIKEQGDGLEGLSEQRRETAKELLRAAGIAAKRIERGIEALAGEPDALDAFRVANRAVASALRRRLDIQDPQWRPFQLAFLLLNLPGVVDPSEPDREIVDLLFFPTGGGKTEAYLGLSAFTLVLRRLRHPEAECRAGAGVSVIMRYTLRLLTLDQLARAAGLICALELEREADPKRYGGWPFEIGLWVGKASTPNRMGRIGNDRGTAREKVRHFQNDPQGKPSPIPLEACPWCGSRFRPTSFDLQPTADEPTDLRIVCANLDCDFNGDRPLPIVAVDEPLYRRLPAFLIATVDKFAGLPWVGPSGMLVGGAGRYDREGFYGPCDAGRGQPLPNPLPPPDLIIQDELHLISGPLGTMAGLYETVLEALCIRETEAGVKPKIVASTATARRAQDQIQALFGRPLTQVFPPPGPDRRDSFFARVVPATDIPARLYLGVAAKGRNPKVIMRRVLLALMGAAEQAYRDAGGHQHVENPADPYMTVLGYFNSLRELGGARRIMEEEVQNTLKNIGRERRRIGEHVGLLQNRQRVREVVELTSRVSTDKVAEARRKLGAGFHEQDRVDLAIATNMISVGLDIPRLGLMVVMGQPKTHSEYIQATSRVGREDEKPGLVVTLLNVHKPRDRSHYERFRHYHETFYRSVEVSSVTPFSARALDRGMAGAMVGLARHIEPMLTPPRNVSRLDDVRVELETRLLEAFRARVMEQPIADESERDERLRSVQNRVVDLLDSWSRVVKDYTDVGDPVQYQRWELSNGKPLLREMLDEEFENVHHRKFRTNRSLRDVEPSVNLFIRDLTGAALEDDA